MAKGSQHSLKRELGLVHVVFAGVGIILGAGIYALIGVAAGETGNTIWLSFLIASVVAGFTGLSYAELSSEFSGDGGEYDYINAALGKKIAFIAALLIIFTGVVSSATVALGFAGYFSSMVSLPFLISAILVVAVMSFVNFYGIKESNRFNILATSIEFVGLLVIIVLGIPYLGEVDLFEMKSGAEGVLGAAALVFFAFMGFETMVKLREETKNPEKTLPIAIIISIIVTAVVYVLVSIAAVSILPHGDLAASSSPLATVASVAFGNTAFVVLGIIALFSTANTILLTMLTTSRLTYDMGKGGSLPKFLSKVHPKRRTPYLSVFVIGLITVLLVFLGNIEFVANVTTTLLFLTFAFVNLSVIILRYKTNGRSYFRMPLNIGRFPVLAGLGIITCIVMLFFSISNIF